MDKHIRKAGIATMIRRLPLACIGLIILGGVPALADHGRFLEPYDVEGRLDMTSVIYGHHHRDGVKRVFHALSTAAPWKGWMLDGEHRVIYLFFDTRRRAGYDRYSLVTERYVKIFFRNGHLRARLLNGLGDPPKPLGYVRVRHAGSSVDVELPLKRLRRHDLKEYKWAFETVYSRRGSRHCPLDNPCVDRTDAGHRGHYFVHDLSATGGASY